MLSAMTGAFPKKVPPKEETWLWQPPEIEKALLALECFKFPPRKSYKLFRLMAWCLSASSRCCERIRLSVVTGV